jgi:hypothetical protein
LLEAYVFEYDLERARELVGASRDATACIECGQPIGDDSRWYSNGTGELVPYCAGCAKREFGPA